MTERPILFSAPMVRALLAGTKTQTRRVVRGGEQWPAHAVRVVPAKDTWLAVTADRCTWSPSVRCPYGQPGDRLWVRESWQYYDWTEDGQPCIRFAADNATEWREDYPEDWAERLQDIWAGLSSAENLAVDQRARDRRWRPSIHMPRLASRILLEVTEVRVQRLQDISEQDALGEGIIAVRDGYATDADGRHYHAADPRQSYFSLWETIHGAGAVDANPWVWAVSFKRCQP